MVLLAVAFLLLLPISSAAQSHWRWHDGLGKTRTKADLLAIVARHRIWLSGAVVPSGPTPGQANFVNAQLDHASFRELDLTKAQFVGASLSNADFTRSILIESDLTGAKLTGAMLLEANLRAAVLARGNLRGASLVGAEMENLDGTGADFEEANASASSLQGAHLYTARFVKAYLLRCDLSGADLSDADLSGADLKDARLTHGTVLIGTTLSGASLEGADLYHAVFEPRVNPDVRSIAGAQSIEYLTYRSNSDALTQLRKSFRDGGFERQDRQVTYALRRRQAELLAGSCAAARVDCLWFAFNRVFFDLTCQYGMSPGRPLALLLALWLVCSASYWILARDGIVGGLYLVSEHQWRGKSVKHVVTLHPEPVRRKDKRWRGLARREWKFAQTAAYFSLLTACDIGFREINLGRWLRLLPRREYELKPFGWLRTIAGVQSLISVYCVALWILTYFGRPFD